MQVRAVEFAVCTNDVEFLSGIDWAFDEELAINALGGSQQTVFMSGIANSSIEALLLLFKECPLFNSLVNTPSLSLKNTPLILS